MVSLHIIIKHYFNCVSALYSFFHYDKGPLYIIN